MIESLAKSESQTWEDHKVESKYVDRPYCMIYEYLQSIRNNQQVIIGRLSDLRSQKLNPPLSIEVVPFPNAESNAWSLKGPLKLCIENRVYSSLPTSLQTLDAQMAFSLFDLCCMCTAEHLLHHYLTISTGPSWPLSASSFLSSS